MKALFGQRSVSQASSALALVLSLSVGALAAACSSGSSPTGEADPTDPGSSGSPGGGPGSEGAPGSAGMPGSSGGPDGGGGSDGGGEPYQTKMPPLRVDVDPAIVETLRAANIDINALPADLAAVDRIPGGLSAVMKTFNLALGVTCEGCHVKNGTRLNPSAETPNKKVAAKMWTEFVAKLKQKDGKPVYCDSCHQGKAKFVDRENAGALATWMKNNWVTKLDRKDGQPHNCTTCHGDPFKPKFIDGWR